MSISDLEDNELIYKILIIGDTGTGKTSIIRKYVHGTFQTGYKCTIGVDFAMKTIERPEYSVKLLLWDIAGQERFSNMTRIYYREAVAAIIVFDIMRHSTLNSIVNWLEDLKLKLGNNIPVIIFANKCDIYPNLVVDEDLHINSIPITQFCTDNNIIKIFKTSALSGTGISEGMEFIVDHLVSKETKLTTKTNRNNINISAHRQTSRDTSNDYNNICCK